MSNRPVLEKPLTSEEVEELLDEDNYICAIVKLDLDSIIHAEDLESFNDIVEGKLLEEGIMSDIYYKAVGILDGAILVQVTCQVDDV